METIISGEDERVVLLLDLDCFYAQCERIRLGFTESTDHETCPIALLQWDSVLAVSYPARKFGIKRGDSWEAVRTKSKGKCLAVHVPILENITNDNNEPMMSAEPTDNDNEVNGNYDSVYNLSKEEQLKLRVRDVGRRRYSTEGKACLERYRVASRRIFEVVMECLGMENSTSTADASSSGVILEKASIDEFFLDVTALCKDPSHKLWEFIAEENATCTSEQTTIDATRFSLQNHKTVLVGNDNNQYQSYTNNPLEEYPEIDRGCRLAHWIRHSVTQKLGFTLSAGISVNKMVAKLGAGYGKPNGQAVILPNKVLAVMQETPLSKVRNFGGKLGQAVQSLLPPNVPATMGSVAQYLSLPQLQEHFQSQSTAQFVFDACRGHDSEPVEAKNSGNLVKSITAFKSLPRALDADIEDPACLQWISLLVREVVSRVQTDAQTNKRYPRNCTLHYGLFGQVNSAGKLDMKSFRIPFPPQRLSLQNRITQLLEGIPKKIIQRESSRTATGGQRKRIRLVRIGVCATEMEGAGNKYGSISNFFSASKSNSTVTTSKSAQASARPSTEHAGETSSRPEQTSIRQPMSEQPHIDKSTREQTPAYKRNREEEEEKDVDLKLARKLQAKYDSENRAFYAFQSNPSTSMSQQKPVPKTSSLKAHVTADNTNEKDSDADLELAKKLQASYDRENLVLDALDVRTGNAKSGTAASKPLGRSRSQRPTKRANTKKISAFFTSSKP